MIYAYEKITSADWLEKEIRDSAITVALVGITVAGDTKIEFKAEISLSEKDILDDIVESHTIKPPLREPLEVALSEKKDNVVLTAPFSSTGGFRFRGASFSGTVAKDQTEDIDFLISSERWINGGILIVDNRGENDTCSFQIVDKDNIRGFGAGLVLDTFIDSFFVPIAGTLELALPYPARIFSGLYVRLKYTSTHEYGAKVKCNLYLHTKE